MMEIRQRFLSFCHEVVFTPFMIAVTFWVQVTWN